MLLEIFDIESLKSFFDLIHSSADIVEFKLSSDKLSCSLLNKSHVCFYDIEYYKDFFESYEVDDVESILVYVDDLYKILKSASKDDTLTLKTNDVYLDCIFEHDGNRRLFELPLAEDYGESPALPSIDYDGSFSVSLKDLKQPCVDLDKIVNTDKFKMIVEEDLLKVVSSPDSDTRYEQEIVVSGNVNGSVAVNVQYINDLQKLSKIGEIVDMYVGNDIPLKIELSSVDDLIKLKCLIAPIIEEE